MKTGCLRSSLSSVRISYDKTVVVVVDHLSICCEDRLSIRVVTEAVVVRKMLRFDI